MAGLLEGKIALITGGSTGIGRATAQIFAREGAKVAVADVNVEGAQQTAQLITDAGGEAIFIKTDVSQAADTEAMVKKVEPVGRLAQPAEIGEAVAWLCSEAASFVTGHPMAVDGGMVAQ